MSRANPFGDLDDFTPEAAAKPVPVQAIERIAETSGFPSRKAREDKAEAASAPSLLPDEPRMHVQRRHRTGRNRQINIKATDTTIANLYRIADELDLPLGAVLERALEALERQAKDAASR